MRMLIAICLLSCLTTQAAVVRITISSLPQITTPSTNTYFEVADMSATPKSRKLAISDLKASIVTNIGNAQIAPLASIARSKIAVASVDHIVINDGLGNLSTEATLGATRFPALTGDVTTPGSSLTTTIGAGTVTEAKLSLSDVTTLNSSTTKHGFVPKLPNDASKYYDGTGVFSTPGSDDSAPINNFYTTNNFFVSGKGNTLVITQALTLQPLVSKLLRTTSSGLVTNATIGTGLSFDGTTLSRDALTGDVTTSGNAATIANDAVTYAKMQNISATQRALGRNTTGSGDTEEVTASQLLDWIGSTRGSVLYRGASGWAILTPNTAGYVLTDGGAGADPGWAAASGGGAGVNTHVTTLAWSGTNITGFNCVTNGESFYLLVTNNCLFGSSTFSNLPAKTAYQTYTLCCQMDSTGGYTVSFTNSIVGWALAVPPVITTNANAVSYVYLHTDLTTNSTLVGTPNTDVRR